MITTDSGLSIHQCVYCGTSRDDEIDALLCGPCATMLAAARATSAVASDTPPREHVEQPVLIGSR